MTYKKYKIELLDTFSNCKETKIRLMNKSQYKHFKKCEKEKKTFQHFSKVQQIVFNYQIVSIKEV